MPDTLLCPYCAERSADSDEHVFPQFLGGKSTIRACTKCNNTFGYSFEASTFEHFKNLMLVFRRCGMKTPRPMVWHKVAIDVDGNRYDIDQDFKAVLSDPILERDQDGKIVQVKGDPAKLKKIAASLKRKGLKLAPIKQSELKIDIRNLSLEYSVGAGPYLVLPIIGPATLRDTTQVLLLIRQYTALRWIVRLMM